MVTLAIRVVAAVAWTIMGHNEICGLSTTTIIKVFKLFIYLYFAV